MKNLENIYEIKSRVLTAFQHTTAKAIQGRRGLETGYKIGEKSNEPIEVLTKMNEVCTNDFIKHVITECLEKKFYTSNQIDMICSHFNQNQDSVTF